mgnify:CR=1 FL=1
MTFWEHLDELRDVLLRVIAVFAVVCIICFVFKDHLFGIIFWPTKATFPIYRFLGGIVGNLENICPPTVSIINTELTGQLIAHMKMSASAAVVICVPYFFFELGYYLWPALYPRERRAVRFALVGGMMLFYCGMLISYFLVFPLAYRFLLVYEVSESISNMISLSSYTDTLFLLCLLMGILFELPIVAVALAKLGLVDSQFLRRYRRHAILLIVVVAAVVTPTTDIFTLLLVVLPVYLLYEVSIWAVRRK